MLTNFSAEWRILTPTPTAAPAAPAAGTVYVLNNSNTIEAFAPGAGNGATPVNTFSFSSANSPTGIAVDNTGRVYVAEPGGSNNAIASFTYSSYSGGGTVAPSTTLTTDAGPWGLAIDANGDLVATDSRNNVVDYFAAGANGAATPIKTIAGGNTQLSSPYQAAFDGSGNLYVLNAFSFTITVYSASSIAGTGTINATPSAVITSSSTGIDGPEGLAVDSTGQIYVGNSANTTITVFAAGANGVSSPLATLNATLGFSVVSQATIAVDASKNFYVAGEGDPDVLIFSPVTSSSATPATTITSTSLMYPEGVSVVP